MVGINRIEELISRERKIFRFLVFYLFMGLVPVALFINSGDWFFINVAFVVLLTEILITGLVKRGKPIHTCEDVCTELSKIKEIDEYTKLRDEYLENKDNTIAIALTVYTVGAIFFVFMTGLNPSYIALAAAGFLILYFGVYLFFRYRIDKITIILLHRTKVIKEMRMEQKREEKELREKRLARLKRLGRSAMGRSIKKPAKPKKKSGKKPVKKKTVKSARKKPAKKKK